MSREVLEIWITISILFHALEIAAILALLKLAETTKEHREILSRRIDQIDLHPTLNRSLR